MQTLTLADGRTLAYETYGDPDGLPVVFCHGFSDSRLIRNPDEALTASLGVRVIVADPPGVGGSSPQKGRTMADWGPDMEQLADSLGVERFAVAGHSGGAPPHALSIAHHLGDRAQRDMFEANFTGGMLQDEEGLYEMTMALSNWGSNSTRSRRTSMCSMAMPTTSSRRTCLRTWPNGSRTPRLTCGREPATTVHRPGALDRVLVGSRLMRQPRRVLWMTKRRSRSAISRRYMSRVRISRVMGGRALIPGVADRIRFVGPEKAPLFFQRSRRERPPPRARCGGAGPGCRSA